MLYTLVIGLWDMSQTWSGWRDERIWLELDAWINDVIGLLLGLHLVTHLKFILALNVVAIGLLGHIIVIFQCARAKFDSLRLNIAAWLHDRAGGLSLGCLYWSRHEVLDVLVIALMLHSLWLLAAAMAAISALSIIYNWLRL